MTNATHLGEEDKRFLLSLSRETLRRLFTSEPPLTPLEVPAAAEENGACFLTLRRGGELRGCIGNVVAQEPLYLALMRNLRDAAQHDSRFPPIQPQELGDLNIEVTVLSGLTVLEYQTPQELLAQLRPGDHGVVLQVGCRAATFLPQVWKMFPTKEEFMNRLSEKAGCEPGAWRCSDTGVSVFQAECFEEGGSTR
jgi:AmmeMemoRadiSam system protein A